MFSKRSVATGSVLDYIIIDGELADNVTEAVVDEDLLLTPYNVKKLKGGEYSATYTDHNAVYMTIKDLFQKPKSVDEKPPGWWKLTDEGLLTFHIKTDHQNAIPFDTNKTVQANFDDLSMQLESVMYECFQKVKPTKKNGPMGHSNVRKTHNILQGIAREGKIQRSVAHHYLKLLHEKIVEKVYKKKAARIAETATILTEEEKFSTDKFWKLNKSFKNKKTAKSSVISSNNTELFSDAAILKEYENEFQSRLSIREIEDSLKEYEERSNHLLDLLMEDGYINSDEPNFTREELDLAINDLKNNSPGQDLLHAKVLKHSGNGLRNAYLKLVNQIKNTKENVPEQLDNVLITALHKKGSKKLLVNKRGIFLTSVLAKVMEKMIKMRINPNRGRRRSAVVAEGCAPIE